MFNQISIKIHPCSCTLAPSGYRHAAQTDLLTTGFLSFPPFLSDLHCSLCLSFSSGSLMTHIKCCFQLFIIAALHWEKSRAAALEGFCHLQTTKSFYLSHGTDQSVRFISTRTCWTLSSHLLSLETDLFFYVLGVVEFWLRIVQAEWRWGRNEPDQFTFAGHHCRVISGFLILAHVFVMTCLDYCDAFSPWRTHCP